MSLSSADRDARIAEIEKAIDVFQEACANAMIAGSRSNAVYRKFVSERDAARATLEDLLRAALSREEATKKDAERLDAMEDWYVDSTGEPFIVGPDARGSSFVVDPCGASDVRVMIDAERAARSVSLSENGSDEDAERDARIAACTRCDGHGWLESWGERSRCGCNPLSENG